MTSHHIPVEQLVDLATNRITSEEASESWAHLADCAQCASEMARLKQGVTLSRSHREEGGDETVANDMSPWADSKQSSLVRVVAVLSFDSRQLSPAFGIRSGRSVARQLLFSIGDNDLDLRVAPDDGAWVVSGQVLGDCGSGEVELRGENITERAKMNELCEFYLPRVPPGSYSLRVLMPHMEIEVPEFQLTA